MPRLAVLFALLATASMTRPAVAQPTPADPIDLVRGLRENGLADLALDYLKELEGKRPTPGVAAVIPLERARAKLEIAATETDDTKRSALLAEAKAAFDSFLAANATHPRRAEAALSLARLVSIESRGLVSKANKLSDDAARTRELIAARPIFNDAAKRFSQAAGEFAKKLEDESLARPAKRAAKNDLYQARLDEAINMLELAKTYSTVGAAATDLVARGKAVDEARKLFAALAEQDPEHPLAWVAKAWVGETELEKSNPVDAQKIFDEVKAEARRKPRFARLGGQTAEFFEMRADFLKAVGENSATALRKSQTEIERRLRKSAGRSRRPTPETAAARFYLATAKINQAKQLVKIDPKTNEATLRGNARQLFQSAERDLRRLQDPENDYSVRAAEARTQVIRTLIGDPDKIDLASLTDFETGLMLAQVRYTRAVQEAESVQARQAEAAKAVAVFERLRQLGAPAEFARDAEDAAANLAYAYLLADQPYQAAVLGDSLARTDRDPTTAARAGLIALNAYLTAAGKLDPTDTRGRRRDLDRAVAVGLLLDQKYPRETYTDSARLQVVRDYLQTRRYMEAFKLAARVADGSPVVLDARYLESLAATELLRAPPAGTEPATALTPVEKADLFQKSLADLNAVPPTPATPRVARHDWRSSCRCNGPSCTS